MRGAMICSEDMVVENVLGDAEGGRGEGMARWLVE